MSLGTLNLTKPGDVAPSLTLNLRKGEKFTAELYWDDGLDLDVHALLATNNGNGAKITDFTQILSTFNSKGTNKEGHLPVNPDGSFSTPEGALTHSGDALTGNEKDVDEIITIDGAKMPAGANEVPIFVTIYPTHSAKFGVVKDAGIRIKDPNGNVIKEYRLSDQFAAFDAVQMGSFVLGPNGWEYSEVAVGFEGDLNTIIKSFS